MIKKTTTAACAVLLAFTTVSCQKNNTEQYLGMQEEMIELMENIKDRDSADKNAGKLADLRKKSEELQKSMPDEEKKKLWDKEEYGKILFRKEPLKQALFQKDYYGSYELRKALSDNVFQI
ncbi:MAG: hypothetical protein K1W09_03845 [Akkermansia muciniphila]|uniref:hypothetical protein n=1 Tax=uncultured Akkermansia sp. TaxID=512294 RepID=UPI00262F5622|nr:hypothetical protein [uncultured Akkermansia sp.]